MDGTIYEFVLSTGGTSPDQIQAWATQSGMNLQEVIPVFRNLLATGAIYYKVKGLIVANPKKAPAGASTMPQQKAVQQAPQQQQRPNPFGGTNYRPPGVGRLRI